MDALRSFREFWETLQPASLDRLGEVYAPDVTFRDPFNDVRGIAALRAVLADMFERVEAPRFVIRETVAQGSAAFMTWDFIAGRYVIHGGSHLRFGPDGRVTDHRDYWDAANELYAHLPVIGPVMRFLKSRLAARQA